MVPQITFDIYRTFPQHKIFFRLINILQSKKKNGSFKTYSQSMRNTHRENLMCPFTTIILAPIDFAWNYTFKNVTFPLHKTFFIVENVL